MTSNISVSVTADATALRSQLALAQADVKTYGAAVRAAAADMKSSATTTADQVETLSKASAAYNSARVAVSNLRQEFMASKAASEAAKAGLDDVAKGAEAAAHGSAGVSRELLVMAHESVMGNWTRLGGSMMVLGERTNALHAAMQMMTPTVMGLTGVFATLAGGIAYLVVQSMHAETALRGVYNAALLQGRSASDAETNTKKFADEMSNTGTVGSKAAMTISAAIQSIPGVADDVRAKLSAIAPAMFEVWGRDADETVKNIENAFKSISGMGSFLTENHLLTSSQEEAYKAAEVAKDNYQAQRIAVDALTARLGPAYAAFKDLKTVQEEHNRSASISGLDPIGADAVSGGPSMPVLRMPQTGTQAESEQTTRQTAAVERYNQTVRERQALEADEVLIQQRIASASTDSEKQMAEAALKVNQAKQQMLKDPGDATWTSKIATQAKEAGDAAVIAAHDAGQKRQQITEAGIRAELAVYLSASKDMTRTDAERLEAKKQAVTLEMSLVKTEAGEEAIAAKQALEAKLATLSAQQAAERGNYAAVMSIEQQKLALLEANGGKNTKAYQDELIHAENLAHAHAQELIKIQLDGLQKQASLDRDALAGKKSDLDAEVSEHLITKSEEIQKIKVLSEQQYQIQHQALADFIANNDLEVMIRQKALDQMAQLEATHAKDVKALNAELAKAEEQTAAASNRKWIDAFSSIGNAGERAIGGLVMGTETYRKAEIQVAQSLVTNALQVGGKLVETWAATELAKTFATKTGVAARVETEQAGNSTGLSTVLLGAAKAIAADASQTFAGIFAFLAPTMGPAAAGPAAAGSEAVMAVASSIPSYAVGAYNLPADMIAQVHQGEMIVPAFESSLIRSGDATLGGGAPSSGGGDVHFHISAMDGASVLSVLKAHSRDIAAMVGVQQSRNPSTRSNY